MNVCFDYNASKKVRVKDFKQHCANLYEVKIEQMELYYLTYKLGGRSSSSI